MQPGGWWKVVWLLWAPATHVGNLNAPATGNQQIKGEYFSVSVTLLPKQLNLKEKQNETELSQF